MMNERKHLDWLKIRSQKISEVLEKHPEKAKEISYLAPVAKIGRPTFPKNHILLKSIQDIAIVGCGADGRRRTGNIRSIKTSDNRTKELRKHVFTIGRSAVYLRIIPRTYLSLSLKLIHIYLVINFLAVVPSLEKSIFYLIDVLKLPILSAITINSRVNHVIFAQIWALLMRFTRCPWMTGF